MHDKAKISENGRWCEYLCQARDAAGNKTHPERICRVAIENVEGAKLWTNTGTPQAPTLYPSVDCQSCNYHGWIINGDVT